MTTSARLREIARTYHDDEKIDTHSDSCWLWHVVCALERAAKQLDMAGNIEGRLGKRVAAPEAKAKV
jgi:hypothetical protein